MSGSLTEMYPVLRFFVWGHLENDRLKNISRQYAELAVHTATQNADFYQHETDVALRKLLEAKDAAVRSVL